jgi:hypothetical protein
MIQARLSESAGRAKPSGEDGPAAGL